MYLNEKSNDQKCNAAFKNTLGLSVTYVFMNLVFTFLIQIIANGDKTSHERALYVESFENLSTTVRALQGEIRYLAGKVMLMESPMTLLGHYRFLKEKYKFCRLISLQ